MDLYSTTSIFDLNYNQNHNQQHQQQHHHQQRQHHPALTTQQPQHINTSNNNHDHNPSAAAAAAAYLPFQHHPHHHHQQPMLENPFTINLPPQQPQHYHNESHSVSSATSQANKSKATSNNNNNNSKRRRRKYTYQCREISSYKIFNQFVRYHPGDGRCDASGITSPECYRQWLESRRKQPKKPQEAFRRALTAHCRGVDGRRPFAPEVEESLLRELRKKKQWRCFESLDQCGSIGVQGFPSLGYHEKKDRQRRSFEPNQAALQIQGELPLQSNNTMVNIKAEMQHQQQQQQPQLTWDYNAFSGLNSGYAPAAQFNLFDQWGHNNAPGGSGMHAGTAHNHGGNAPEQMQATFFNQAHQAQSLLLHNQFGFAFPQQSSFPPSMAMMHSTEQQPDLEKDGDDDGVDEEEDDNQYPMKRRMSAEFAQNINNKQKKESSSSSAGSAADNILEAFVC